MGLQEVDCLSRGGGFGGLKIAWSAGLSQPWGCAPVIRLD